MDEKEIETQETEKEEITHYKIFERDYARSPEPDWRERERFFESQRGF